MTQKFTCKPLLSCLPICRGKLYEDVIGNEKYGPVHRIWLSPGHVFISVRDGRQLITFDNKTTSKSNEENFSCLDLTDINPPLTDVISDPNNPSLSYLIQQNGHVQCWKFRADLTWVHIQNFNLCEDANTRLVSVCLHPTHNVLYWCEERNVRDGQELCHVNRRTLPTDETKLCEKEIGRVETIMYNCTQCQVFPTQTGIAVVLRNTPPLTSLVMLWQPSSSSILVSAGPHQMEVTDVGTSQSIDFVDVAFKFLSVTSQIKDKHKMVGVTYDSAKMEVYVVEEDGTARVISSRKGDEVKTLSLQKKEDEDLKYSSSWFYHMGCLWLMDKSKVSLYSIKSGELVSEMETEDRSEILGMCNTCAGCLCRGFYSKTNIYIIQCNRKCQEEDIEHMVQTEEFQTPAIHLAYLEQLKSVSPSTKVKEGVTHLRELWGGCQGLPTTTKLAEIVNPYLEEYWHLDKLQQNVLMGKLQQSLMPVCSGSVEEEVLRVLSPETNMTMSGRQAWLLVLGNTYPKQVLTVLESQMDFDTEDISTSQIQRWQCILANDSAASPVSSDVAVPVFEHICRLLYQINPAKLLHFVKICQMINDQKVGVSAFIRKRQAIQYYDRALTSVQDLRDNNKSKEAVVAYVNLLLASERNNCQMLAARYFLKNKQWSMAINLLKDYTQDKKLHSKLFNIILRGLNDGNVLSEFAEEIFQLMPNENFLANMSSLVKESSPPTARDVFSQSPEDIPVGAIRPILLRKISDSNAPV